ncbi:MAG: 50S ribosomal protein L18 [Planctomycetales bacterium 4484_113]|nr:MAG: 50S ribosomal protein L18 [Planctomycetales bacterium 4484_113]
MAKQVNRQLLRVVRHRRVRRQIRGTRERPRLAVFRSSRHIYAQIIDDINGHTLVAASTLMPELRAQKGSPTERAALVGRELARLAVEKGIAEVVFDRGGHKYHGRTRALAEAAREAGLKF